MNRIIRMLGVDKAIRYVIFGKIISVLTGLLLIMLISHHLSKDAQGYYYTFNSVVALQIIFELGLSTVIIQFASHEMSALKYDYSERDIIGESKNKQRYLSLFRLAIKWYAVIALLIILIVGPIGYVFFTQKEGLGVPWQGAWLLLTIVTAFNIFLVSVLSVAEGSGLITDVNKMRMYQSLLAGILAVSLLISGFGLYATSAIAISGPDQLHISYVHSPIRYAWDLQHQYLNESNLNKGIKGWLAKWLLHKIRIWDSRTANGVDHFIANSQYIARRIKKVYRREASVIYPPVDVDNFEVKNEKQDYYFTASRMVPYKRIDLIVEAFSKMPEKKLVVIGDGPEMKKIKSKATDNIKLLGYQSFPVLKEYMQSARAFVFAAEEDFGIIPVEAQACGTPVIAFGKGGALETVRPLGVEEPTGIFFKEQNIASLHEAVSEFEKNASFFTSQACRKNAEKFSRSRFEQEFKNFVNEKWNLFKTEQIIKR